MMLFFKGSLNSPCSRRVAFDLLLYCGAVGAMDSLQLDNFHLSQEANPAPCSYSAHELATLVQKARKSY